MGHSDRTFDVAVIGAGVFGAWTAFHLRRAGQRVALIDAWGAAHGRASSGGESRIIRMGYGADEIYTRFAMRSLVIWQEFLAQAGEPLFHRTGVLWTASAGDPYTEATRQIFTRCGVKFELLTPPEMAARYPQMHFAAGTWGIFEPDSGALMARRAVQAVADAAARNGVTYMHRALAQAADRHTIRSGAYVFACGPWLPKLFPGLLSKRIVPSRQEAFFFAPPPGDVRFSPPEMPVWVDFSDPRGPYGFPNLENRGVKVALDQHGPTADPDTMDRTPSPESLAAARDFLGLRFPALRGAPLAEARVCQYSNTSNGDFLIDRHPDFSDIWLVGGGSGHGFKHGPAVGEYVTSQILGTSPAEPRFGLATKAETPNRTVF